MKPENSAFTNAFEHPNPNDDFQAEKNHKKPPKIPRKWKIILIFFGVIILIFGIIPGTIYLRASNNSPDIPTEDFEIINQFQLENEVASSVVLLEPMLEEITLRQSLVNRYIYSFIRVNQNSMYDPDSTCQLNACQYLYHELDEEGELLIGVKAIWVEFEDEQIFVNAAIDYNDLISISTVARFEAEINFNIDRINLEVVDFKLDNFNVPGFVLNQIQQSLSENLTINLPEAFDGYLDVDLANLSGSVRQADLRYVLESTPARIEAINVVDGGVIIVIRYIN